MPDYSGWARDISEGSEEHRGGVLMGIRMLLVACEDDMINENGPHVLLQREAEFVAALVSLACDSSAIGDQAICVVQNLAVPEMNRLPLFQFPGLLDALIASPHVNPSIGALTWLCGVKDEAQQVALATNTALVDLLVANVGRDSNACAALCNLCSSVDNNRALLYEYPGLITAVTDATRVPACALHAVSVMQNMSCSASLKMPMLRNPLVLDALLPAAGSDIDEVSDRAIMCLSNLSRKSENRALMRDGVRIVGALKARVDDASSKRALCRICYIGDLPNPKPTLDLSLVCSRDFHHKLSLCKALIREHPEQLSVQDSSGRTPLNLARDAHLPAPIIGLLAACFRDFAAEYSLAHLVGYKRSQIPLVRAQRHTLMCCLVHLANAAAPPAAEDSRGELNPGKALKGYLAGGIDPWSIIGPFAF
ncbi:hypothetical protein TeGR_g10292 [Tetraparma gracilis]|uniref:Uncharacterized protein n=1 Tax=Tetraparma gracilis TaxID=2962635 RepID=A0ABQ6MA22_9STRA|nr:hypothetical protein TeGR_g10292 [Tetraparma gracilis]